MTGVRPTAAGPDFRSGGTRLDDPAPFRVLLEVETRKQVDTRAGRALVTAGAVTVLLVYVAGGLASGSADFGDALMVGTIPLSLLLPLVAILAVTTEWTQRTAQVTFVLEPRRGRVLAAKILGSLVLAAGLGVLAVAAAAVTTLVTAVAHGRTPEWSVDAAAVSGLVVLLVISTLQGAAFGAALQHTVAAMLAFLVLPTVFSFVATLSGLGPALAWVDLNEATAPLLESGVPSGAALARLLTATAWWVGVPLLVGAVRFTRREVA